jgi:hypothetical protein
MLTEKELQTQQAIIAIQRRLMKHAPRAYQRYQLRHSCGWATDEEFQGILDSLVSSGIAVHVTGPRGAELYRSAITPKQPEVTL